MQSGHSFTQSPFTSTYTHHNSLWVIIITAVLFFAILAWYDFASAVYTQGFIKSSSDEFKETRNRSKLNFGFAILWTAFAVSFYYILLNSGQLDGDDVDKHPVIERGAI